MPIKGSIPTLSDFEKTANTAIDNSKKQEEAVEKDTSKPALAKKMVSTYGKYVFLGISAIGIIYKMFFVDIEEPKRKLQVKKDLPISQQKLSKKGKTRIEASTNVPINLKTNQDDLSFKSLNSVEIPQMPSLKLPTVPTFDNEAVKIENQQTISDPILPTTQAVPVAPTIVPSPPLINAPEKPSIGKNEKNINLQNKSKNQIPTNPEIAKASQDMFLIKGEVSKNSNQQKNSVRSTTTGPRDFIIFDGSGLSLRTGNIEDKVSSTQVTNLSNTLATGKMVEAVLETAIDSENQGPIRAVVSKDVYGETGTDVLVPKGSRLYGTYSTQITPGQSRVAVMFSRILRPDGVSIAISADAGDKIGKAGIAGDVDSRYFEMLQNSLLLSFLTLGTAVVTEKVFGLSGQSQIVNNNGSVATTNITPGNAAAQSMINTASTIAKDMATTLAQKIQPVISVPHGYLIVLTVNKDIIVPKYKIRDRNAMGL